ncbi:PREDICTED: uncharacterized protein LOC108774722 isoform X2 [Cyphomyrmex costatus]|uniref:uncharacterized protein LOC108774722 isoform X2 n=1 Tax=Cyphomyrmex costatus TaxID=456900 RepID=UPI000852224D|nr:PREDICTED: uncharacterized protein LOC108774722 isoform X2 [Cyphomyrmex costatus]
MRYPDSRRYERGIQPHKPESGLIATTSSSVCARCGVALHLKDSSERSKQFVIDRGRSDDYGHENGNIDRTKRQDKVSSKSQSTGTSESGLQSKLLFIRRKSPDRIARQDESQRCGSTSQVPRYVTNEHEYKTSESSHQCIVNISSTICSTQDAATLTQEMLCPCACGLLVKDGTESKVSINPMSVLKDELIKTKLKELDLHLDSTEITQTKVQKIKKIKMQKLEKDMNVKRWIEEVVQLRLQMQIEELHKSIQFFKQENEHIRRLAEKCRCLSEDIKNIQQLLPIRETYSERAWIVSRFTTTIKHLQAKYHHQHGIIATLTEMFRGSINIQQIATKLLAPFIEHWNPSENITATHVPSASGVQAVLKPSSSMVFDVY